MPDMGVLGCGGTATTEWHWARLFLDFEPRQEKNTATHREWPEQETSLDSPGGAVLSFNFKTGYRRRSGLVSSVSMIVAI